MVTWNECAAAEPELADAVLRDAKHVADASEIAFELWIDRVMHTRWEKVLTPAMRSVHRPWRAPAGGRAPR